MKKHLEICLGSIFLFNILNFSCSTKNDGSKSLPYNDTTSTMRQSFEPSMVKPSEINENTNNCSIMIINDTISNNLIDIKNANLYGLKKIFPCDYQVKTELNSEESESSSDTIYHIHCKGSTIDMVSFKPEAYSFRNAEISDTCIILINKIRIGMPKKDFFHIIKEKFTKCDSIIIVPTERSSINSFFFEQERLKHVTIKNIIY